MELHYADGGLGWLDVVPSWRPADDEFTRKMMDLVCSFKNPRPN